MTYRVPAGRSFGSTAPVFVMAATLALLGARLGTAGDEPVRSAKKTAPAAKTKQVAVQPPVKLALEPSKFELSTPRSTLQLVATGTYAERARSRSDGRRDVDLLGSQDRPHQRDDGHSGRRRHGEDHREDRRAGSHGRSCRSRSRLARRRQLQERDAARRSPRPAATWGPATALPPARTAFDFRCAVSIRPSISSRCGPSITAAART